MESIKPRTSTSFLALLLLLLTLLLHTALPSTHAEGLSSEVYEIDYKGPETHPYQAPPHKGGRRRPYIHDHQSMMIMAHPPNPYYDHDDQTPADAHRNGN